MTPREMVRDQTSADGKPFAQRELALHGKPNWAASIFFASIASLHLFIVFHSIPRAAWSGIGRTGIPWEAVISAVLGGCFVFVAVMCALVRSEIAICPRKQCIHLSSGVRRFSIQRDVPFSAVRAVRVRLWQTRRGAQSRVEILCNGEEIPCPPTAIPRQEALYLALVMKVRLIKISDDRSGNALASERSESGRW